MDVIIVVNEATQTLEVKENGRIYLKKLLKMVNAEVGDKVEVRIKKVE
jgi:hypothetical protein